MARLDNHPKIAVIGCGSIGRRHIQNLKSLGASDLIAFEPNQVTRNHLADELNVEVLGSLEELWELSPTMAIVASPSNFHIEQALLSARRNCDLFIEKPLSYSLDGVDALCGEATQRGLTTLVGCNMRFHPGPLQVKAWLDGGVIGEVLAARLQTSSFLPDWRPGQDYRKSYSASPKWGGAVLDCIHEIDMALWLLGPAAVAASVTRPATNIGLDTDGLAEIILVHDTGAVSNLHLSFIQRNYRRTMEVIGTDGTIEWDFGLGQTKRFGPEGYLAESADQPADWQINQMYVDEMRYFLDRAAAAEPTFNPIDQAAECLKVALQARATG